MSFLKTLSEKLGFTTEESDERDEDELEDGEIQEEDYDEEGESAFTEVSGELSG